MRVDPSLYLPPGGRPVPTVADLWACAHGEHQRLTITLPHALAAFVLCYRCGEAWPHPTL